MGTPAYTSYLYVAISSPHICKTIKFRAGLPMFMQEVQSAQYMSNGHKKIPHPKVWEISYSSSGVSDTRLM